MSLIQLLFEVYLQELNNKHKKNFLKTILIEVFLVFWELAFANHVIIWAKSTLQLYKKYFSRTQSFGDFLLSYRIMMGCNPDTGERSGAYEVMH